MKGMVDKRWKADWIETKVVEISLLISLKVEAWKWRSRAGHR